MFSAKLKKLPDNTTKRIEAIVGILRYQHHSTTEAELPKLMKLPLADLTVLHETRCLHRAHSPADVVEAAKLLNEYERRCP